MVPEKLQPMGKQEIPQGRDSNPPGPPVVRTWNDSLRNSFHDQMDAINEYFAEFPEFRYHPTADWRQLRPFNKLARQQGWSDDEREIEFRRLQEAWTGVVEFEFRGSKLEHYQSLCEDLEIDPLPESISKCRGELKVVFVNIVDLMQYRRNGKKGSKPERFPDLKGLKKYSLERKKYYPLDSAKAEVLQVLLKVLQ
jgi:hypothetical protein